MRFGAVQGKRMFNKRLTAGKGGLTAAGRRGLSSKKKSRNCGSQELTGRRQTKWLQPLGKNPDHWIHTVNTRKA